MLKKKIKNSQAKNILIKTKESVKRNFGEHALSLEAIDIAIESISKAEEYEKAVENVKSLDLSFFSNEYINGFKDCIEMIELNQK